MEPADRAGLHWQPLAATDARQLPLLPDEPVRSAETCPDCRHPTLWQRARSGRGGTRWCPNRGWEESSC